MAHASQGTGHIDALSLAQEQALTEMRRRAQERAAHPRFHDLMLLRFLRARKFDVEAAWRMFSEHLDWREDVGLDSLGEGLTAPGPPEAGFPELPAIKRHYPHGFHGTDRQGRPLYIERLGRIDLPNLLKTTSPERILQYFTHECERQSTYRLLACSLAAGRIVENSLTVLDLSGFSRHVMTQTALKTVQALIKVQNSHYPETMGEMIIINAPWAFNMVWRVIRPMLDPKTVAKITGLDGTAQARLQELVHPSNLPRFLGGDCDCGHCSGGCLASDKGPWKDPLIAAELESVPQWVIWNRFAAEARRSIDPSCLSHAPLLSSDFTHDAGAASDLQMVKVIGSPKRLAADPENLPDMPSTDLDSSMSSSKSCLSSIPSQARGAGDAGAACAPPALSEYERLVSSDEALQRRFRKMEELYFNSLEAWLVESSEIKRRLSATEIQRIGRLVDAVGRLEHAKATVNIVTSEFCKVEEQCRQRKAELEQAERGFAQGRPETRGDPPNGLDIQGHIGRLSEYVTVAQTQRERLHSDCMKAIEDSRKARAIVSAMEVKEKVCWCCPLSARSGPYHKFYERVAELDLEDVDDSPSQVRGRHSGNKLNTDDSPTQARRAHSGNKFRYSDLDRNVGDDDDDSFLSCVED